MKNPKNESVIFYSAFGLSILLHLWLLVLWAVVYLPKSNAVKSQQQTNITYFSKSPQTESEFVQEETSVGRRPDFQPLPKVVESTVGSDELWSHNFKTQSPAYEPDFLDVASAADKTQKHFPNAPVDKRPTAVTLEKISVPMISSGSVSPQDYPEYFNRIGKKIQRKADKIARGIHGLSGEVRAGFTVRPDGQALDVRALSVSGDSGYRLGDLAVEMVQAAGPFDSFPAEMGRDNIPFEVVIQFDLD